MNKKDIQILDNLMFRTESLPDILHLRAAEYGYQFTDNDKELLLDTYSKLDDILKEVAAFINIKFPGCERHVRAWGDIDFDAKIGPFKVITTDREHIRREWKDGLFDLKSLIKVLKNETILLIDDQDIDFAAPSLESISSNHTIDYYQDEKNIPNQELVNSTINYFQSGVGSALFSPIDFLNLLNKQNEFVKLNVQNGELVIQHLINLPLTDRKKHALYGFILKWFGGYPINNLNEDFDKTLKLVQREFLSFDGDTPEKHFCKADQAMRNKFEKYGIAFTTAINHNIDVDEILTAMEVNHAKRIVFHDFGSLFNDIVNKGLLGPFSDKKALLIAQSTYNYEFNVWLQSHKSWEYRNEKQYERFLNPDFFVEFLDYKNHANPVVNHETYTYNSKPTLRQIALICHYTDRVVTRDTGKAIATEYNHTSGDALFNHFTYYRSKANRTGVENTRKKNDNKLELFDSVLTYLNGNDSAQKKIMADISTLKEAINKSAYNL